MEPRINSKGGSYAQVKLSRTVDSMVIVFLPALAITLRGLEQRKGSALSEEEVLAIRDEAACLTMVPEHRDQLLAYQDFTDIDPEYVWKEWQERRVLSDEEFF